MSKTKCPKCGYGATLDPIEAKPTRWFSCGSEFDLAGDFRQSKECEIMELKQKLAKAKNKESRRVK